MRLYFLLTSITFLQLYIPISKSAKNMLNINSVYICYKNLKDYANIFNNQQLLNESVKELPFITLNYNISLLENIKECTIFVVDGDIYGERKQFVKASLLSKIKQATIISLQEHMNFKWSYDKYIDNIDYCVFINKSLAEYYNKLSPKNVYLGNPKFDDITPPDLVYNKYNLDDTKKYGIFLYPRQSFLSQLNITFKQIINFIKLLEKITHLEYIIKYRPKDVDNNSFNSNGLNCKTIVSDCYPNQSVELMQICKLCVMFSSSCIDECIITKTPCLDCEIDYKDNLKMKYLRHPSIIQNIRNWENISEKDLRSHYNKLASDSDMYIFDDYIKKYLCELNTSSTKIINHLIK